MSIVMFIKVFSARVESLNVYMLKDNSSINHENMRRYR